MNHFADELNRRLLAQYTEIAALAGALAHEIKNPLSTIGLNMELLAEEFTDAESPRDRRAQQKIAVVRRECSRLQGLLDDFLNFAKVRSLRLEPGDLNDLLVKLVDFFRPQALEHQIEQVLYLDPDLPMVVLDREALRGAIFNLILNAQQAMPNGGQLTIRTRPTAAGVAIDLIDTGVGMDEKTRHQIFDAFFSTKQRGSGLGLPTTRKVIEAHNGRIAVQSEVGRGTQFTVELPVPPRLTAK